VQAKAIFFTGVNEVAIGYTDIPEPEPLEVLIKAHYTCISPGTELRNLATQSVEPGWWPLITGYSLVGEVVQCGSQVALAKGTRVFCSGTSKASHHRLWGGHVEYAVAPEHNVHVIPDSVDMLDACLAKLTAITLHGVRLSRPLPNESVAVVGLGPIGQLAARTHALTGAHVVATDLSSERVTLAQQAGMQAFVMQGELGHAFSQVFPDGADIVVDATGVSRVLSQAVEIAKVPTWGDGYTSGARYLIQGSYPDDFCVPYGPAFMRELTLLIPRDQQPRDLRDALALMHHKQLRVRDLISDVRSPEEAPKTYAELQSAKGALMTVAFDWAQF
jgi:2-desacetyl-2-hydroxyethyl bacteriochlorophyllide A dehydrogenase